MTHDRVRMLPCRDAVEVGGDVAGGIRQLGLDVSPEVRALSGIS